MADDDITNVGRRGFLGGLAALGVAPKVVADALTGEKTSFASGVGKITGVISGMDAGPSDGSQNIYEILRDNANSYYLNRISLPNIWRERIEYYEKQNPHVYMNYREAYQMIDVQFKSFGAAYKHQLAQEWEKGTDYDVWFEENRFQAWCDSLDIWEKRLSDMSLLKLKNHEVQRTIADSYRYLMDNSDIKNTRHCLPISRPVGNYDSNTNMLSYVRKNPEKYPNIMKIDTMFGDIIKNWI